MTNASRLRITLPREPCVDVKLPAAAALAGPVPLPTSPKSRAGGWPRGAWQAWQGEARHGEAGAAWPGPARQARQAGRGRAWQARQVWARRVTAAPSLL